MRDRCRQVEREVRQEAEEEVNRRRRRREDDNEGKREATVKELLRRVEEERGEWERSNAKRKDAKDVAGNTNLKQITREKAREKFGKSPAKKEAKSESNLPKKTFPKQEPISRRSSSGSVVEIHAREPEKQTRKLPPVNVTLAPPRRSAPNAAVFTCRHSPNRAGVGQRKAILHLSGHLLRGVDIAPTKDRSEEGEVKVVVHGELVQAKTPPLPDIVVTPSEVDNESDEEVESPEKGEEEEEDAGSEKEKPQGEEEKREQGDEDEANHKTDDNESLEDSVKYDQESEEPAHGDKGGEEAEEEQTPEEDPEDDWHEEESEEEEEENENEDDYLEESGPREEESEEEEERRISRQRRLSYEELRRVVSKVLRADVSDEDFDDEEEEEEEEEEEVSPEEKDRVGGVVHGDVLSTIEEVNEITSSGSMATMVEGERSGESSLLPKDEEEAGTHAETEVDQPPAPPQDETQDESKGDELHPESHADVPDKTEKEQDLGNHVTEDEITTTTTTTAAHLLPSTTTTEEEISMGQIVAALPEVPSEGEVETAPRKRDLKPDEGEIRAQLLKLDLTEAAAVVREEEQSLGEL